jgi:hypothetical protein
MAGIWTTTVVKSALPDHASDVPVKGRSLHSFTVPTKQQQIDYEGTTPQPRKYSVLR